VKYKVTITRDAEADVYVEADSRDEAKEIAEELPIDDDLFDAPEDNVYVALKPLDEGDVERYDLKGYPIWVGGPSGNWEFL
jgi:hypothetical protein